MLLEGEKIPFSKLNHEGQVCSRLSNCGWQKKIHFMRKAFLRMHNAHYFGYESFDEKNEVGRVKLFLL